MKGLVIYDSVYGNTEMIAEVIAYTLGTEPKLVKNVRHRDLKGLDLIVVGSPTHAGRPTPEIEIFLKRLSKNSLRGVSAAAFDTRFDKDAHGRFLHMVMRILGYAAPRIQAILVDKGGIPISAPEGFIVQDKKGNLAEGKLNSAREWAELLKRRTPTTRQS